MSACVCDFHDPAIPCEYLQRTYVKRFCFFFDDTEAEGILQPSSRYKKNGGVACYLYLNVSGSHHSHILNVIYKFEKLP